jgi:hypothetical protein
MGDRIFTRVELVDIAAVIELLDKANIYEVLGLRLPQLQVSFRQFVQNGLNSDTRGKENRGNEVF